MTKRARGSAAVPAVNDQVTQATTVIQEANAEPEINPIVAVVNTQVAEPENINPNVAVVNAQVALVAQVADAIDAEEVADTHDRAVAADSMASPSKRGPGSGLTPPPSPVPVPPSSPSTNRERFRASMMPSQITCDLSGVSTEAGIRWSFQAIVIVVYPAAVNPLRRHVLLSDGRGVVGVTVWNANVNLFGFSSIGQMAHLTKVSITVHNNVRGLTLNKESTVTLSEGSGHFAHTWWRSFLSQPPMAAINFHDSKENHIVNVSGILGSVSSEAKVVRNETKMLLTLKLVDRTGIVLVRSWNHSEAQFAQMVDKPILLKRLRVTAFASTKIGELLDGAGTVVHDGAFAGSEDLERFWQE